MDHVTSRQPVAGGDLGPADLAAAQLGALGQQTRPRRLVYRAVHAAPPSNEGLAALTIASTFILVMSPVTCSITGAGRPGREAASSGPPDGGMTDPPSCGDADRAPLTGLPPAAAPAGIGRDT